MPKKKKLNLQGPTAADEIARLFLIGHEIRDIARVTKLTMVEVTTVLAQLEQHGLLQVENAIEKLNKSYDLQYSRVKNWTLQTLSIGLKLFFEKIVQSRESLEKVKDHMRKVVDLKGQLYLETSEPAKRLIEQQIYKIESEIRIEEYRIAELSVDDVMKLVDAIKLLEEKKVDQDGYTKGTVVMAGMTLTEAKEVIQSDPILMKGARDVTIDNGDFLSGIEEFIPEELEEQRQIE